ncbi:flagellar basal body-associated FliL family protein [Mesomycoplasma neurolyticum]|uniref:Lipoprotein n=1 Tax=Mesomycoplasma neurolyticum TaxID=2120 RepID=A0A449A4F8_9BACT|nr:hypothetical protein [Mesomycoplasma neurolyticum]VEU59141.1 Uncharacterised protein [Mesomycoplasma neurolyticum]
MKKRTKIFMIILVIALLLSAGGGGAARSFSHSKTTHSQNNFTKKRYNYIPPVYKKPQIYKKTR